MGGWTGETVVVGELGGAIPGDGFLETGGGEVGFALDAGDEGGSGFVENNVGAAGVLASGAEFFVAETEGVEFDGAGAIDAPMVLRDGDGELAFVGFVSDAVGFIHDVELAGEAVLTRNVGTRPASVGITRNGVKDRT